MTDDKSQRDALKRSFLAASGYTGADRRPLAGDASSRSYERLTDPRLGSAVLMDAPPAAGEDITPFRRVAAWLLAQGLSAPREIAADPDNGFLLLEDLGDLVFARVMARDRAATNGLYDAACDVLEVLASSEPPDWLTPYAPDMRGRAELAWTWYLDERQNLTAAQEVAGEALDELDDLLARLSVRQDRFIHRDWHAENLILLPDRQGPARVGILDFQDAQTGAIGYDLVSMTTDARRDVEPEIAQACINRIAQRLNLNRDQFAYDCAVLSVQRNLRILGVFARLSLHFGKPHYVDLIPRVWRNLTLGLAEPGLERLQACVLASLPVPDDSKLEGLKARCGSVPTL